ncbi:MAG: hypothetical protein JWO91_3198 [Acidobacteriaceae bacterium]|nr:hypothetical protein [Acidobacteriaceae bacterium]
MGKRTRSLWLLVSLAILLGLVFSGIQLNAQQSGQYPSQPTAPQAQQPGQMPSQPGQMPSQPGQAEPDSQTQSSQTGSQVFTGTIAKAGNLYVLQDATGISYNIDHQELAQKYEGKQVRIKGTLDADGKTIHVQ